MQRLHEDQDRFRDALNFSEAETTFTARLVEKDYYCTVLLEYLPEKVAGMVFKGGTCLAKVHGNFFRLSEDLDFVIPVASDSARTERRKLVTPLKTAFDQLVKALPCFQIAAPLTGANQSTQYIGVVNYRSLVTNQDETIKIEVALREPLLTPLVAGAARTVVLNPSTGHEIVAPVSLACMSKLESFAEKFRAALTRREVAARDFFDLDYAVRKLRLKVDEAELVGLIRRKLSMPGNGPIDVSERRLVELRQQVGPQLEPVLRSKDLADFEVERAFRLVAKMAAKV